VLGLAEALEQGLHGIFQDRSQAETPLNIAWDALAAEKGLDTSKAELSQSEIQALQDLLRDHLNRPTSSLSLYRDDVTTEGVFPPQHGENSKENWIFALEIPSLSDHIYWIVVEREGKRDSYVYGFN
jgi:hypothetical protein